MKQIPRTFKAKIKKIPAGGYCYGEFLGGHPKRVHGKLKFKGGLCPFWQQLKHKTEDEDAVAYCSFMHQIDDLLLADQIRICGHYDMLFDYKTGRININNINAECLLINDLPQEQQEPFRMWLNGYTAYVPTIWHIFNEGALQLLVRQRVE